MGFTKLMDQILQSSIMAEDPPTFKVWIALLAACKSDSIALVSPIYLSAICHLSQDVVDECIKKLSSPDPYSRSLEHEGRRIERVDGGYKVLNYLRYREFTYSTEEEATRKREYRKKIENRDISGHPGTSGDNPGHSASASASIILSFLNWWKIYPRRIGKLDAEKAYGQALKAGATVDDLDLAARNYCSELARLGTEEKYVKHPATFLRSERWKDYMEIVQKPLQVGETRNIEHSEAYWVEVARLKAKGIVGAELTAMMSEFKEEEHERTD